MPPTPNLLTIDQLHVHFPIREGMLHRVQAHVKAVNGVSMTLRQGEVFGLVGESGCGKTTLGRSLLGLTPIKSGEILFHQRSLVGMTELPMVERSLLIQLLFQDPYSSLHPRKVVRDLVGEGLELHGLAKGTEIDARVLGMLERVGLSIDHLYRYAHEFSGGQRQRIALARALVLRPELVILDEPTSALDVSVQAQILNLLKELLKEFHLTYLFISHDLGVVRYMSNRIGVMYLGKIVETGETEEVFNSPHHPYTKVLLSSLPSVDPDLSRERIVLVGDPPNSINPPSGCVFVARCPQAKAECHDSPPSLEPKDGMDSHQTACFFPNIN